MGSLSRFGTTSDGAEVERIALEAGDISVAILSRGAVLQDFRHRGDPLTLGSPDLAAYEGPLASFGSIVGPVAGRIAHGRAVLDGREIAFERGPGAEHLLHGGAGAVHRKIWTVDALEAQSVTLTLDLPDGEAGFPGNRHVAARFALDASGLTLTISTTTDAPTFANLTNHSYWCLGPAPGLTGMTFRAAADRFLPGDGSSLATGEIRDIAGSHVDFRSTRALTPGMGIDNGLCLADAPRALTEVATLSGFGRALDVATTEPGMVIFDAAPMGSDGFDSHHGPFDGHAGFAIECQGWPAAPNHPHFPSIRLGAGETGTQVTRWSVRDI